MRSAGKKLEDALGGKAVRRQIVKMGHHFTPSFFWAGSASALSLPFPPFRSLVDGLVVRPGAGLFPKNCLWCHFEHEMVLAASFDF